MAVSVCMYVLWVSSPIDLSLLSFSSSKIEIQCLEGLMFYDLLQRPLKMHLLSGHVHAMVDHENTVITL